MRTRRAHPGSRQRPPAARRRRGSSAASHPPVTTVAERVRFVLSRATRPGRRSPARPPAAVCTWEASSKWPFAPNTSVTPGGSEHDRARVAADPADRPHTRAAPRPGLSSSRRRSSSRGEHPIVEELTECVGAGAVGLDVDEAGRAVCGAASRDGGDVDIAGHAVPAWRPARRHGPPSTGSAARRRRYRHLPSVDDRCRGGRDRGARSGRGAASARRTRSGERVSAASSTARESSAARHRRRARDARARFDHARAEVTDPARISWYLDRRVPSVDRNGICLRTTVHTW